MIYFGERLKQLRIEAGYSQLDLAQVLGLSRSAICYYEKSKRNPSTEIIVKISEFFDIPVDSLLEIDNNRVTLDVTGLTGEEIKSLQRTIDKYRKNHEKESKAKKAPVK